MLSAHLRSAAATLGDRSALTANMRLATSANEAYTASLAVSELLGLKECGGGSGQDEVHGRGAGRVGGYRAKLPGLHRGRGLVASPPSHPNSVGERSLRRATLEQPPWPTCLVGASRVGCAPQVKGRPVMDGGCFPP